MDAFYDSFHTWAASALVNDVEALAREFDIQNDTQMLGARFGDERWKFSNVHNIRGLSQLVPNNYTWGYVPPRWGRTGHEYMSTSLAQCLRLPMFRASATLTNV